MARIRYLKIGFFQNEELSLLSPYHRLAFSGLWLLADREGRLEDRPKRIGAQLFPYEAGLDIDGFLHDLAVKGFIARYSVGGLSVIQVLAFHEHQRPRQDEQASQLPAQPKDALGNPLSTDNSDGPVTQAIHVGDSCTGGMGIGTGIGIGIGMGARVTRAGGVSDDVARAFETFRQAYPVARRVGGKEGRRAFESALKGRDVSQFLPVLLAALEQHQRSEQWQTPKYIPLMTTWLNQERWETQLPEARVMGQSVKTAGNQAALERFVARKQGVGS